MMASHGPRYWNQMVERTLNDRRKFAKDLLYLGDHYFLQIPLVCPLSLFSRHGIIYGPPGTGKTVMAAQLIAQLLAMGHNVIVVDCKGSWALLNDALAEAARAVDREGQKLHEVRVVNPSRRFPSHVYNPCQQKVWKEAPPHTRAQSWTGAMGIFGEEASDTAYFAAQAFMISTLYHQWFPEATSSAEFLSLINDRHLYSAKGGNLNDWAHSRHVAANLLLLASAPALNAVPSSPEAGVELTDLFVGDRASLFYFYLSAIEDQRISGITGRFVLEQLRKAASCARQGHRERKTFVICDEAQELFGAMAGNALEQLREFGVSVLLFHQSRSQLVTGTNDFRERFENAVGVQICLGVRTPTDFAYLMDTDREEMQYSLSWQQSLEAGSTRETFHPQRAYSRPFDPRLINISEVIRPRLDRNQILRISSDPQAGFIRGFLNDGLWAFNGSWVPFRWFHHLSSETHRKYSETYPSPLPGQISPTDEILPPPKESPYTDVRTSATPEAVRNALDALLQSHRQRLHSDRRRQDEQNR